MDYKEIVRDAKVMAESFRQDGNVYLPNRNGAARRRNERGTVK